MSRSVRLSLVVLGLALVVYGTASLTGGWLGMPPWWWEEARAEHVTVFAATQHLTLEQIRSGRECKASC